VVIHPSYIDAPLAANLFRPRHLTHQGISRVSANVEFALHVIDATNLALVSHR